MNKIYTHPGQPEMQVEVILASKPAQGIHSISRCPPIITLRARYPRIIHSEVMTHRVFSRNARSSRAVPVKTMIQEVREKPFVPWHWGKNQKGMQAGEDHKEIVYIPDYEDLDYYGNPLTTGFIREEAWQHGAYVAADVAEGYTEAGYHKQIPNRLLEPFMWIDTLITATDWDNFIWLRDHKDAEPHIRDLAVLIKQAIAEAEYQELGIGEWHLPYIADADWEESIKRPVYQEKWLCALSAARCARISYKPFDGIDSYERELERYNLLVNSDRIHASPIEHQAKPDVYADGKFLTPNLHGNFTGWIQNRKLVEHLT